MKKNVLAIVGILGFGISMAQCQTLLNSWENSLEGWTIAESGNWSTTGYSTTTGVTAGTYSWNLTAAAGPDYGVALVGPSSTALTAQLVDAGSISIDVLTPVSGSFGYYQQWDLQVNQPGGAGTISLDGNTYNQSPAIGGPQSTLTWAVPASVREALAGHPSLPVYLSFSIGGGGSGTMYVDYLRVNPVGLIDSWESSAEVGSWTNNEPGNWTSVGLSTSTGVTAGLSSWELTASAGPDYGLALSGPGSTALTSLLANSTNVSVDVLTPVGGSFGYYLQFDLQVNQPGGAGTISLDGGDYGQSPSIGGPESTLTWPISPDVRAALTSNPSLPTYLTFKIGGGGAGTMYLDNLRAGILPPSQGALWVRELWDDLPGELLPSYKTVTNDTSSVGFSATDPWTVNPAEVTNCQLMAFRPGFPNDPLAGANTMGLPGTLDGSYGSLVQENNNINFFPTGAQGTFWTAGDFMTRGLDPAGYIDFNAVGEYWFAMTIANSTASLDAQYVQSPATGAGGIGFADGSTTNADFVAVGVTGLNVLIGLGQTNASKSVYISQGTLGQSGDPNSLLNAPSLTSSPTYSQTNFTGGPYYIRALDTNSATIGTVEGDGIVVLGHLKTFGNGTATLDAKYYTTVGGSPWNYNLDTDPSTIIWDCSYSFNFTGTMTRMLLFQNGQFPFYVFGFRASTNFNAVVGLDPGRIQVSPLADTYVGYPINITNLAVEANSFSFESPPAGYGTLNYQWYQNGLPISGATSQNLNIASASTSDSSMPAGTDAGVFSCVTTDPSGTWGSVTNSVTITVTQLSAPVISGVTMFHNQNSFLVTFSEPNLTGVGSTNDYIFTGGIVASNVTVVNNGTTTEAYVTTSPLPLGTKVTLTISGVTNVVGGTLTTTNLAFWTDLVQKGVANFDAWLYPTLASQNDYFNNFVPANSSPPILQSESLTSWDGPGTGITIVGTDGYTGDGFGSKVYGWFIPPVTTNYVFFLSCDDGGRLSLSTNDSPTNLVVIACDSLWNGPDEWTNITDQYPSAPHRGDGTATAVTGTGYVWDNSTAAQSPATACDQNRSDQFIVAYWDSSGITGAAGEPAGATDQANWAATASSLVSACVPASVTNFWPNVDANGQALIKLQAGKMYYMQLEHVQIGGGYDMGATFKIASEADPNSGVPGTSGGAASALTGSVIAGTVPFSPSISISETASGPVINYNGVLLAGTNVLYITNVVAQSSAATAISLGGPSKFTPAPGNSRMFYRTSE
ncbi:MAG TPA: hypothetical protein VH280_17480 [Verrucomicrobiae bacterium]|jgi:hypothetical protein|nr:hypothetical protein [Verrucomicrobiae bacterium]